MQWDNKKWLPISVRNKMGFVRPRFDPFGNSIHVVVNCFESLKSKLLDRLSLVLGGRVGPASAWALQAHLH